MKTFALTLLGASAYGIQLGSMLASTQPGHYYVDYSNGWWDPRREQVRYLGDNIVGDPTANIGPYECWFFSEPNYGGEGLRYVANSWNRIEESIWRGYDEQSKQVRSYRCGDFAQFQLCETFRSDDCYQDAGDVREDELIFKKATSVSVNYYNEITKPLVQTFSGIDCENPMLSFFSSHLDLELTSGINHEDISSVYVQPGTYVIFTADIIPDSAVEQTLTSSGPLRTWDHHGDAYPMVKRATIDAMDTFRVDGENSSDPYSDFKCEDLPYFYFNAQGMLLCSSDCAEEDADGMCCFVPSMYW